MSDVIIIDDVLPKKVHQFAYNFIISEGIWCLNSTSFEGHYNIAGRLLWEKNNGLSSNTSSQALAVMIYHHIQEKAEFLSNDIERIHLGAKAALQDDKKHKDSDKNCLTVLYYLNTYWKKEWGGKTTVGKKKIEYKPNRALIYDAKIEHGGEAPKGPVFRTYINYVINQGDK